MFRRVVALALVLGSGASQGAADIRSEELVREWIRSVDAHPAWSAAVARVSSDGSDTIIDGLAVSLPEPLISIGVARIRLRDLSGGAGGGFAASEIEASGSSVRFPGSTVTIPAATAVEVLLPALPALNLGAGRALTATAEFYSALAKSGLDELSIPEMTIVQSTAVEDQGSASVATATYRNLRLTDLQSGVLARSEAGPVTVSNEEAGAPGARFEISRIAVERADFGAIAHVLDEGNYRGGQGDGIWRPALARLRYSGISADGADGTAFRLDELGVEGIETRQPPRPFLTSLETLANSTDQSPAEAEVALETVSDFLDSFRIGAVRLSGLSVGSPGQAAGSASLASMAVLGASGAGVDAFDMRDLRFASPAGVGEMKSLEFAGLQFPDYTAFLDLMGLDQGSPDHAARDAAIRKALYGLPKLKRFSLTGVSAGQSEAVQVALNSLTLEMDRFVGPFPAAASLSMEGLRIPSEILRLEPQSAELFQGLGITDLTIGMSLGETWQPEAGRVDATFGMAVENAGELDLDYTYSGVTEDWLISAIAAAGESPGESDTEAVLKVLDGLGLESATLRVTDRSLLDRAFGYAAAKQKLTLTGPAYREQMRGALPFMLSMAISADLAKLLITPLQSFLAGGQTLIAEARPAAPIPLPALSEAIEKDPMSVPALLNLTVRSEPPAPPKQ